VLERSVGGLHLRPVFLAGPTAVGKSAIALALAEKIGGEIITVDSMQVYRGLDIGTAKPTSAERARVPHHCLDLVDADAAFDAARFRKKIPHHLLDVCALTEAFDAAQFIRLAQKAVAEIQSRGNTPIFCGGTGLYFKAYLDGLGEAPPADEKLRAELEATPFAALLAELRERDPSAYEKIDRQNPRRVIRAVEVIRLTGKKFSEQRATWTTQRVEATGSKLLCFTRPAEDLHRRINARVDEMFRLGLVAETRALLQHGLAENKFALQAIGYRQVAEHLRGERDLAATIELVNIKTRQFAKRQLTWFRRHGNCTWIELKKDETTSETIKRLAQASLLPASG
jgi:tRNA dimethylallyltransferase